MRRRVTVEDRSRPTGSCQELVFTSSFRSFLLRTRGQSESSHTVNRKPSLLPREGKSDSGSHPPPQSRKGCPWVPLPVSGLRPSTLWTRGPSPCHPDTRVLIPPVGGRGDTLGLLSFLSTSPVSGPSTHTRPLSTLPDTLQVNIPLPRPCSQGSGNTGRRVLLRRRLSKRNTL